MPLQMLEARASVLMEVILDKLKLLNYELRFCYSRVPRWPRLHKFYFSLACEKQNDQFLYFVSLVAWLLSLIGRSLLIPSQDDPDTTCMNIMLHFKELGFAPPSWPSTKLKEGYGDAVCCVLDSLTNLAMEAEKFEFCQPIYKSESSSSEDEAGANNDLDEKKILRNNWSQLNRNEGKMLSKKMLENHEKSINLRLEPLMADYSATKSNLTTLQQKHDKGLIRISELTSQITNASEQLERLKQKLMEKGNKISDVSSLFQIKAAVNDLKVELQKMEIRIGVLEHVLLQNQIENNFVTMNLLQP